MGRFLVAVTALIATAAILVPGAAPAARATAAAAPTPATAERVSGPDRYSTVAQAAQAAFPSGSKTAILVNGEPGHYPDALAANYLAGQLGAPILLATTRSVPLVTLDELGALGARQVWLVGGGAVLGPTVTDVLRAHGIAVIAQLGGTTRYDTDAAVVTRAAGTGGWWHGSATAVVTRGDAFPDALAAGPLSYAQHFPVILTTPTRLSAQAATALRSLKIRQVVTVGGAAAVSPATVAAIRALGITVTSPAQGQDRSDTANLLADWEIDNAGFTTTGMALASGAAGHEVDALAAGFYAGIRDEPLLVTVSPSEPGQAAVFSALHPSIAAIDVLGGTAAVADTLVTTVASHTLAPCRPAEHGTGWVTAENTKTGDASWFSHLTGGIEGYAGQVSASCGSLVRLYVNTTAPTFTVRAYRMGYYHGAGARLVWTSTPQPGQVQPAPTVDPTTQEVSTDWAPSTTIPVTSSWPAGDYLLKLVASDGESSFVPLVVRDDASTAALLVQNAVLTYEVYNKWGGHSGYSGPSGTDADRSRVVSFDRPYIFDGGRNFGDGTFLVHEYPFIEWAESHGYDLAYTTDVDVDADPAIVVGHKALVELGHTEYWSDAMRSAVVSAAAHGVNVAWLGANDMYWRVRLSSTGLGPDRAVTIYKKLAEIPIADQTAAGATVRWRDPPINQPEQQLEGVMYDCLGMNAAMVVTDPTSWLWQHASVQSGTKLVGLLYGETDRYFAGNGPDVQLMAHSPFACPAHNEPQTWADLAYHTDPVTEAGVIAVGTMAWVNRLEPPMIGYGYSVPATRAAVQQATANILNLFARGPAGRFAPAHTDTAHYYTANTRAGSPHFDAVRDDQLDGDDS